MTRDLLDLLSLHPAPPGLSCAAERQFGAQVRGAAHMIGLTHGRHAVPAAVAVMAELLGARRTAWNEGWVTGPDLCAHTRRKPEEVYPVALSLCRAGYVEPRGISAAGPDYSDAAEYSYRFRA